MIPFIMGVFEMGSLLPPVGKIVDELNYINVRSIKEIDDIWLSAELDLRDNKTSDALSSDLFKKEIKVRILNVKKSNLENAFIELMN